MLDIKCPVSWDDGENAIIDSEGKVRILFCWKNDTDHVVIQTHLGKQVVDLINSNADNLVRDSNNNFCADEVAIPSNGDKEVKVHPNKGKPAWWIVKGMPHPRWKK